MTRAATPRPARPGLSGPLWLLLGLILLSLILSGALWLQVRAERHAANVNFARHMIQHHLQAVDMAKRLYDRTDEPVLKSMAYDILSSQTEQVGQMRAWLNTWGEPWGGSGMTGAAATAMGLASQQDVRSLSTLPVEQAEVKFLQLMTRHHEGALLMVEDAIGHGVHPHVQALARQMRGAQGGEIKIMTDLLEARGAAPLPPLAASEHAH